MEKNNSIIKKRLYNIKISYFDDSEDSRNGKLLFNSQNGILTDQKYAFIKYELFNLAFSDITGEFDPKTFSSAVLKNYYKPNREYPFIF